MPLIYTFLFVISLKFATARLTENSFSKCCFDENVMAFENETYVCDSNAFSNIKIINHDRLTNISAHYCVEVFGDEIFVFEKGFSVEFKKLFSLSPSVYSKCCPLGYTYNTVLHSCEENFSFQEDLSSFRFVRIGLPYCKIILDFKLRYVPHDFSNIPAEDYYCLDNTENNLEVVRVCTDDFGVCKSKKCIHKCCPDGQSFVNGSFCQPTYVHGVNLNFSEYIDQNDDFAIIHGYTGKIYLQPFSWEFHLDSKGVFRLFDEKFGDEFYEPTEETYCIEHASKNGVDFGHRLFRKYPETQIEEKFIINGYVMIISSIFLLITVLFYICSGETKKLFGRTLVSFCICLILTFFILIYSTFRLEEVKADVILCHTFGFLLLYGEFSTFLWLKLLCFDIYYTFGSGKMRNKASTSRLKRFLLYSLYGWGLALIFTSVPLGLFYADILPEPIRISMGTYRCAIDRVEGNYADLLFRTVPVTIIQSINLFLFFTTVKCCIDVKNEIRRINDNDDHKSNKFLIDKERFILVTKLSVIMGLSYVFEVVSSFYDFSRTKPTKYLEIVWDIINCLQGVFIFLIFVCKKKMVEKIKTHAGVQKLRKISFSSGATLTTHLSFDKEKKKKLDSEPEK